MRHRPIYFILAILIIAVPMQSASRQSTPFPPGGSSTQSNSQTPAQNTQTPTPPPAIARSLAVVVVDPAHGGADPGAHGASGILESDVALSFSRVLRISLETQGLRVILTRQANEDPSFDDRSKIANAQRGAIFINLHVSSTGQPGSVRVYSLVPDPADASPRTGLLSWDHAQANFAGQSRKLAELIQIQMAQRFPGSPEAPMNAPVRQLRTVGTPAVSVEVSSVSVTDRGLLDRMGPALADGIARAVVAFRTIYESGGK